jgi:hypothetical protein
VLVVTASRQATGYILTVHLHLFFSGREIDMKIFKYLALLALASVPLLLIDRKKREAEASREADEDIFEHDLRVD